jgi:formylglycine-generating enzyme required for sulfatase activity
MLLFSFLTDRKCRLGPWNLENNSTASDLLCEQGALGEKFMKKMKAVGVLVLAVGVLAAIGGCTAKQITLDLGNKVSMKLVLIPAGKFMMGSPKDEKDRKDNEGPQHEVMISKPFYMGVYAVTQEQYEQIMGNNPSQFRGAQNPVECVSWDDAVEFCKKLSQKTGKTVALPTEAEWEYACRAGSKTRFSYGDDEDKLGDYAWYDNNSGDTTHPVGQKKPNAWGLYDMHGNVWQWCSDWCGGSYANANKTDPTGPASGSLRVLRGGSWNLGPWACPSAYRNWGNLDGHDYSGGGVGFRVVAAGAAGVD